MQSLYTVQKNLEVKQNRTSYIEAGIRENLSLVEVTYGVSPNGNEFIAFTFEDVNGDKFTPTEYAVRLSKAFEQMSEQEQANFLKSVDSQKRRIGQIVTTFVSPEQYAFVANNFKEFAENIIRILNNRDKSLKCRVKIVYNDRNFTALPRYWAYTFIEPMTVAKENSKIRILNIDKIVKDAPDVVSNGHTAEVEVPDVDPTTTRSESPNDLPF